MTRSRFSSFWRFALATYRKPGVEAACLVLQDRIGADVPLVLLLLYAGATGCGVLTRAEIDRAKAVAEPWAATVVRPLRLIRRELKVNFHGVGDETFRQSVKRLELQAERLQMTALAELLPEPKRGLSQSDRMQAAAANLAAYLGGLDKTVQEQELNTVLQTLIEAAVPQIP